MSGLSRDAPPERRWLRAEISMPIDRGGRLMGARHFDGYNCTERGGARLLDDGPEKMSAERREWQLWPALCRVATAALIYSSICSPR